jgi:hypothetical protein
MDHPGYLRIDFIRLYLFLQTPDFVEQQVFDVESGCALPFVRMFPGSDSFAIGKASISSPSPAVATPRFRGKLTLMNIKSHETSTTAPFVDPPTLRELQ